MVSNICMQWHATEYKSNPVMEQILNHTNAHIQPCMNFPPCQPAHTIFMCVLYNTTQWPHTFPAWHPRVLPGQSSPSSTQEILRGDLVISSPKHMYTQTDQRTVSLTLLRLFTWQVSGTSQKYAKICPNAWICRLQLSDSSLPMTSKG